MPTARFPEVLADLRAKILDGTHPEGEPLPHTEDLMQAYGVGRYVITTVMRALKEEGLVWRVANRGMIVQRPAITIEVPMAIERRDEPTAWAAACRRAGTTGRLTPQTMRDDNNPAEQITQLLHLTPGVPIITWELHGDIGGLVVCLDQTFVSKALHEADAFDIERSNGVMDLRINVRPASPQEAAQFRISRNSSVLDLLRVTYNDTGQPLQLLKRTVNPQRVRIIDQRLPLTSPLGDSVS
ncbi:GntR family transcriptional regulator [Streptosporangium sp. NPDC020072]|uniref:GntR family transcriptional regulator n=1 Tax=Streptosporangium sp. NPDC020072 TaxID=3154788 RepID=UPI0034427DD0